jgi:hypothetical protein
VTPCQQVMSDTSLPSLFKSLKQCLSTDRTVGKTEDRANKGLLMVSWSERLDQAKAKLADSDADPLRGKVAAAVRGMEAISTVAMLDLIGLPNTTGNARRISKTMRALGYIPIKSRRLVPGGWNDTLCRGWARAHREAKRPVLNQKTNVVSTSGVIRGV